MDPDDLGGLGEGDEPWDVHHRCLPGADPSVGFLPQVVLGFAPRPAGLSDLGVQRFGVGLDRQ